MEEILASIRRIITDDQDRPPRFRPEASFMEPLSADPAPSSTASPDGGSGAIAETGIMAFAPVPDGEAPDFAAASFDEGRFETEPEVEPLPAEAPTAVPARIVSDAVSAAVAGSFGRLAAAAHPPQPARTMEEHVTEMLRPMLQAWLDENLPALVERLVAAEVERLARRGR